jgi:isopentenyl diphosphate isomerase/L-lactate dehydrogenase-like FMN-dependent dehydrogenase
VNASTEIFGVRMDYPILVAPSSNLGMLHPTADVGAYQAATANGTLMSTAHGPSSPHDEIAAAANGPRWIQLYPGQNMDANRQRLQMYRDLGALAMIFTVDQQAAFFERAQHNRWLGGEVPESGGGGGGGGAAAIPITEQTGPARYRVAVPGRLWYNWDAMSELRDAVDVPVLVKGILTPEDAEVCIRRGFDGIIVSNHGARSLDYAPSTLEVLPEIVDAVNGRMTVLIDSGFRSGSDAFKAIALGADGVCLGRAVRWGHGAFGPAGFQRVLEIVQAEFRQAMARTGRATLAAVDRTAVRTNFA